MASPAPPVGIPLGKEHAVGQLIGQGAFGKVHAVVLLTSKEETEWAVKLTEIPTRPTKKKSSPAEVAQHRLWWEGMVYREHFHALRGTVVPNIPSLYEMRSYYSNHKGACAIH